MYIKITKHKSRKRQPGMDFQISREYGVIRMKYPRVKRICKYLLPATNYVNSANFSKALTCYHYNKKGDSGVAIETSILLRVCILN